MRFRRGRKVDTLFNIAPLIDCVFLLLIFFLLTSSFIEEAGLEIDLPESARAAIIMEKRGITISLSERGALAVNGRPSSLKGLRADVAAAATRMGKDRAVLRADRDVRLGLLTRVMDEVKAAGIRGLDVQTVPPVESRGGEK